MKKRILMSKSMSILMVVLGIITALILYDIGKNDYGSFEAAFSDPLIIPISLIAVLPFLCACMHYVVTDEGIKGVTRRIIKYDDIIEVGVNYGGKYDKNPAPKVTYIKYRMQEGSEKYDFLAYPSKELYSHFEEFHSLNFVKDTIDEKRRIELTQPDSRGITFYNSVLLVAIALFFVAGLGMTYIAFKEDAVNNGYVFLFIAMCGLWTIAVYFTGIFLAFNAELRFDEDHVYVKYYFHKEIAYKWDEFQEVCITYMYAGKKSSEIPPWIVIGFVRNGTEKTAISKKWPIESGFWYKQIPYTLYSEKKLEEVKKYCPHEIVDLRGTGTYYH